MTEADLIAGVLEREGDKFTNDPNDAGGPTKYGVTQRGYSLFLGRPVSVGTIRDLEEVQAIAFYHWYFEATGLMAIHNDAIRIFALDFAVLSGRARAVKGLQKIVGVATDGICGPLTVAAVNGQAPRPVLKAYIHDRMDHLISTALAEVPEDVCLSTDLEYLHGWWHRVFSTGVEAL